MNNAQWLHEQTQRETDRRNRREREEREAYESSSGVTVVRCIVCMDHGLPCSTCGRFRT